jgi:transcriptional regulator with XRE-family HTH domain
MAGDDSNSLLEQIGRNIAERRKQLNMKQDQLAEALNVEPQTISRFERATHAPSLKTLEKLATVLAISITDLLNTDSPPPPDELAQILSYLHPLDSKSRRFIMVMLREWSIFLSSNQPPQTEIEDTPIQPH